MSVKGKQQADARRQERLQTRLERLEAVSPRANRGLPDSSERAQQAVRRVQQAGCEPEQVLLRSSFIRYGQPLLGNMSDRKPPKGRRPPAVELISPRGVAQQLELLALFVAHNERRHRSGEVTLTLPLEPRQADELGWLDLIVTHATHTPAAERAVTPRDNRLRQLKHAFDVLADPSIGLVELPRAGTPRRKYDDLRLLDEGGARSTGEPIAYRTPKTTEDVVPVPVNFWLNGWVHLLTDSEIAAWLMFRHLHKQNPASHDPSGVSVSGEVRLRYYGLSKEAWSTHRMLERFGLLRVEEAEGRRPDGTYENYDPSAPLPRHRFWLSDDGLRAPAAWSIKAGVAAAQEDLAG